MLIPHCSLANLGHARDPASRLSNPCRSLRGMSVHVPRTKFTCTPCAQSARAYQTQQDRLRIKLNVPAHNNRMRVHIKRTECAFTSSGRIVNMHMSATSVHTHIVYNCVGTANPRFLFVCTSTAPNVDVHIKRATRMPSAQSVRIVIINVHLHNNRTRRA